MTLPAIETTPSGLLVIKLPSGLTVLRESKAERKATAGTSNTPPAPEPKPLPPPPAKVIPIKSAPKLKRRYHVANPKTHGINWLAVGLGKTSDGELAAKLGVTAGVVKWQRYKRNIQPSVPKRHDIKWREQPLGELTDYALATILGVGESTVQAHRKRLKIPSFKSKGSN